MKDILKLTGAREAVKLNSSSRKISAHRAIHRVLLPLALALQTAWADEDSSARVTYLANSGVMISQGEAKVLVDPLYRLSHGFHLSVPGELENKLLNADPPYNGIDAVLITHFHLDHFSPNLLLNYLMINTDTQLFAPEQAVEAMRRYAVEEDQTLLDRVTVLDLSHFGKPARHGFGAMVIEAVRIPHTGWPDANRGTQNIVYRVTLNDRFSALHLGDAAPQMDLFAPFGDFWNQRPPDVVLAPYWFFLEADSREILDRQLQARAVIGLHVPAEVPPEPERRREAYRDLDLFTTPGETRQLISNEP